MTLEDKVWIMRLVSRIFRCVGRIQDTPPPFSRGDVARTAAREFLKDAEYMERGGKVLGLDR
jgi:hypothetical protein